MKAFWIGLGLCGATVWAGNAETALRPNILYLYADDLGWGSIGANGQTRIKTPELDGLAAVGVNFLRSYGCNVCSPARSSQQTGFHQGHTWSDRNDPASTKAIRQEDLAIGDLLSAGGYTTGYFGKWGYGANQDIGTINDLSVPAINNPQTLPISHGYDVFVGELHHVRAHTFFQPTLWHSDTRDVAPATVLKPNIPSVNPSHPTFPAYQNEAGYPTPAYCDDTYAFAALDFVREQAQTPDPFFCLMAFQIPHTPLGDIDELPRWFEAYDSVDTSGWATGPKQFAAMVTRMDAHIGNLLAALDDPNNDGSTADSIRDNTLIIFSSDNGGQGGSPESFFDGNSILRGAKGSVYEGGIRVPTLMSWPGRLPEGVTTNRIVDVTDMLPTFCDLAGVETPVGTDGVSLAPTLTGEGFQRKREFVIHEAGSNWSIVRGDIKLTRQGGSLALYDLGSDPSETTNLAVAQSVLVTELQALALGERVEEPDNFAHTHHQWTGPSGGSTSDADHWSDTPAPNPVVDTGPPRASWNAVLAPTGTVASVAVVDAVLDTLALEVEGIGSNAVQTLRIGAHTVTGRNEIRVDEWGRIELDNGTLSSLRWVDVRTGGVLEGAGVVDASLYNTGTVSIRNASAVTNTPPGVELIQNGGFEEGTGGGSRSFDAVSNWGTDGPTSSLNGAVNNTAAAGTYRGLIQANTTTIHSLVQNTGVALSLGDTFTFRFSHRGFSGWDAGDTLRAVVFYEDGGGARHDLISTNVTSSSSVWNETVMDVSAVVDGPAVGRAIQVVFEPASASEGGTEFASIDSVSLVREGGVHVVIPGHRRLEVRKDYVGLSGGTLDVALAGKDEEGADYGQLVVTGEVFLAGSLALHLEAFSPALGDTFEIVTGAVVRGEFAHADGMIERDGHHFRIHYGGSEVTLEVVSVTSRGTPHWWLEEHLGTQVDYEVADGLDPDLDGRKMWEEYIAGTLPGDGASALRARISMDSDDAVQISWPSAEHRRYRLEAAPTPAGFSLLKGGIEPKTAEHTEPIGASTKSRHYFRVSGERK